MHEAVTMPSLMMTTSIVSEESLAIDRDRQDRYDLVYSVLPAATATDSCCITLLSRDQHHLKQKKGPSVPNIGETLKADA